MAGHLPNYFQIKQNIPLLGAFILSPFSKLLCISFFKIFEIVAGSIEMKYYDTNEGDF